MIVACVFIVVCVSSWALWTRRETWAYQWERPITAMIALGFVSMLLCSPLASWMIGPALHTLTGKWNLEDYAGHMCGIGSAAAGVWCCVRRLRRTDWLHRSYKRTVELPTRIIVPILFVLFWFADATDRQYSDFITPQEGPLLQAYWLLLDGFYIYLLTYTLRALITLRHRADLRPQVPIYMRACVAGIMACLARDVSAFWPSTAATVVMVVASCWCVGGFAFGAGRSWLRRVDWFNPRSRDPLPTV